MRIGLAMALVVAGMALVSGCSKKDLVSEYTPVPQPAASAPSAAPEETVIQRPMAEPAKVRLAHMTEAELAQLILEVAATARDAIDEDADVAIDEPAEENRLYAELVR